MRHGSLFSGIGGFDLAAEWMGWENVFHCEWNPFGQRVLHHYWPHAETFTDITKTDFTKYYGSIDIISGGFPCQPYSSAGKRKGKEDERHLWPEMLRAIREVSPRFVVGENVRGLTNWNGGMVFDEVCAELESLGYQVAPVIIPACSVGAPHKRERVWFVAQNSGGNGCLQRETEQERAEIWQQRDIGAGSSERFYLSEGVTTNAESNRSTIGELGKSQTKQQIQTRGNVNGSENMGDATNASGSRFKTNDTLREPEESVKSTRVDGENVFTNACGIGFQCKGESTKLGRNGFGEYHAQNDKPTWDNFPTQPPICSGNDGFSGELDGITFPKWRNESIKAYGNAIVPQVAYEIFKAIDKTI